MANRTVYRDHGLVFAKEWADVTKYGVVIGDPLQMNNIGQREFAKLIEASGVRWIKFHGLRHTSATLALKTGVPVNGEKLDAEHQIANAEIALAEADVLMFELSQWNYR